MPTSQWSCILFMYAMSFFIKVVSYFAQVINYYLVEASLNEPQHYQDFYSIVDAHHKGAYIFMYKSMCKKLHICMAQKLVGVMHPYEGTWSSFFFISYSY